MLRLFVVIAQFKPFQSFTQMIINKDKTNLSNQTETKNLRLILSCPGYHQYRQINCLHEIVNRNVPLVVQDIRYTLKATDIVSLFSSGHHLSFIISICTTIRCWNVVEAKNW